MKGSMVPRQNEAPCIPCACVIFSGGASIPVTLTPAKKQCAGTQAGHEPQSGCQSQIVRCEKRQNIGDDCDENGEEKSAIDTDFVEYEASGQLNETVCPEQTAQKEGKTGISDTEKGHELGGKSGATLMKKYPALMLDDSREPDD